MHACVSTMRAPPPRSFSIAANTRKLEVDNRFPLKKYYRTADNILKQAHIYREEKNLIELYVLLLRFSSLVGETIPEHGDYKLFPAKQRTAYNQKLTQVLLELEKLKPEVQKQVDILNNELADTYISGTNRESSFRWPTISRNPAKLKHEVLEHVQVSNNDFAETFPLGSNMENSWRLSPVSQGSNFSFEKNELVPSKVQSNIYSIRGQPDTFSLKFPIPNKETLSRHSFLGPDGLRARWKPPVTQARVEYPSYVDPSFKDVASMEESWSKTLLSIEPPKVAAIADLEVNRQANIVSLEAASLPDLIKQPSPVLVAAAVQDLPIMDELMQLCKPVDSLLLSNVVEPLPGPIVKDLRQSEEPKKLHISFKMMDEFMKLAVENTRNSIETCGVLAGYLKKATFYVTALIIPKQEATSNTCQTVNEEEIFEWQDKRGLFQLGWIHTHPTQSCFMSSVDLHTHYSYQVMLPEAIAIVMAPTDSTRKYGIFRLSDPVGVRTIQSCQLRGFHAHNPPGDGTPIYERSAHVLMSSDLKYQVVDLR